MARGSLNLSLKQTCTSPVVFHNLQKKENPGNSLLEKLWSHMTFPLLSSSCSPPDSSVFQSQILDEKFSRQRRRKRHFREEQSVCKTPKSLSSMVYFGDCKHISEEYNASLDGQLGLLVWLSFSLLSTETRVEKYVSTPDKRSASVTGETQFFLLTQQRITDRQV